MVEAAEQLPIGARLVAISKDLTVWEHADVEYHVPRRCIRAVVGSYRNANYYDRIYLSYSPSYRYEKVLTNRQAAYKAFPEIFAPTTLDGMSWTEDAVAQEKGHGGWMVDLSIGKSVRLKKGSLNFNLMITNLLNNQTIVTGGYEQNSRSSYTLDANGNVKNPRLYQFSKNPKKYYTWGTNGMFQVSYRF
jgi:hypothetical protein